VVPATGVTLNKTSLSLAINGTETLMPTIQPSNATNKNVTWSSSNNSVATVNASGLVTVRALGTARITVTTQDGGFTAYCDVDVLSAPSFTLHPQTQTVNTGQTATFMASANGNPTPTDQWQISKNNGVTWQDIAGATSNTYTTLALALNSSGNQYRMAATNIMGSAASHAATVTVIAGDWVFMSAGPSHTVALKADCSLWAWGTNTYGQLGDGTTSLQRVPVQVGTDTNWEASTAGSMHTVALKANGTLWAWGSNQFGQLGNGTSGTEGGRSTVPVQVGTDTDWAAICAGDNHTLALKTNGTLWSWGYNAQGQLGIGNTTLQTAPVQVGTANDWEAVSAGGSVSMGLRAGGRLWSWGYNSNGQLGLGSQGASRNAPAQVSGAANWVAMSTGGTHSTALKADGTLWSWGINGSGQLGIGVSGGSRNAPTQVGEETTWAAISAGNDHTLAVKADGTLWSWGNNTYGQLGFSSSGASRNAPVQMDTSNNWSTVSAGTQFSFGIKADNTLWGWGVNNGGQLGDSTSTTRYTPVQIK
jgi:alpha-tubulin suppressor-like RCC1 family protein